MDLLTPPINVPAERAKLRALRDEFHERAMQEAEYRRRYTARGYPRQALPDVQELATQGLPGHGTPGICQVCARPGLGLPAADADVQAAFARGCGEGCAAGCLGCAGVKA